MVLLGARVFLGERLNPLGVATSVSGVLRAALRPEEVKAVTAPFFPTPRLGSAIAWSMVLDQPLVGVLLAWHVLGEQIRPWEAVGGVLVVTGVVITTLCGSRSGPGGRA
jgi:EamA domain-containing membrane protein RarD